MEKSATFFKAIACLLFLFSPLFGRPLRDYYFIAIQKNDNNVLDHLSTYIPFHPPPGKYYADPILFKYNGINYIFFEDYDYKKGVISYVTIDEYGCISEPKKILELPIHLSFPALFKEDNQIYMIPETYHNNSVTLFQAVHFPDKWVPKRVLIEGQKFSDPILFKHNGYYWLFAAIDQDQLVVFYSESLEGHFLPHPINHSCIRGRNAGLVYASGNRLIRPTMDCSKGYGRAVILKEIFLLTPQTFLEEDIAIIEPTWAPHLTGTHSFSQNEDFVVYDGRLNLKHMKRSDSFR